MTTDIRKGVPHALAPDNLSKEVLPVKTRVMLACARLCFFTWFASVMLWKIAVGAATTPFCAYKAEKQM